MKRKAAQPVLIPLPTSANLGCTTGEFLGSAGDNAKFFTDGFKAAYAAQQRDSVNKRNAVRQALIAKYKLQ